VRTKEEWNDTRKGAGVGSGASILLNYLGILLVHTVIFLGLFQSPLFADSLLFYRGICLLAVSFLLCAGLAATVLGRLFRDLRLETAFSAVVLSCSLHLVFFVVVPVTVDRSVSTRMLEVLASSGGAGLSRSELEERFTEEFLVRDDALGRRLREQVISRNLREQDGRYVVTEQGASFLRFSRFVLRFYR
jgi:hypothetical protein